MRPTARGPVPAVSLKPTQVGDMGYIRRGHFHLLFSTGCPLDERQRGVDVPLTFEPLGVEPTVYVSQPRLPSCLSVNNVRESGTDLRASVCPVPCVCFVLIFPSTSDTLSRTLESSTSISFEHRKRGNRSRDQVSDLPRRHPTRVRLQSIYETLLRVLDYIRSRRWT